jgi:putative molybdopterin biosynthesis protein
VHIVNRQRGSGVRWLSDQQLQVAKLKVNQLKGYETEVWTHWEVGLQILRRHADVGVATEAVARILGLAFSPLVEERFDLVVLKDHYFTKPIQALLQVLTSDELQQKAALLGGYNTREAGKVVFPG